MYKIYSIALIMLFVNSMIFAQSVKKFDDSASIKDQFESLMNNSNTYEDFKVVRINWLLKLKSNVSDSLNSHKTNLNTNADVINTQQTKIDSLKMELNETLEKLQISNQQLQSVSFFGMELNKSAFKSIIYLIIVSLIVLILFLTFQFNRSNSITKQTKLQLKELEDEFAEHRKRALEREQKVMRKLQDEINKQKKDS